MRERDQGGQPQQVQPEDDLLLRRLGSVGRTGRLVRGSRFIAADRVEDFTAVDRHFLRGFHPETDLVPSNLNDDNRDIVVDHNALIFFRDSTSILLFLRLLPGLAPKDSLP